MSVHEIEESTRQTSIQRHKEECKRMFKAIAKGTRKMFHTVRIPYQTGVNVG